MAIPTGTPTTTSSISNLVQAALAGVRPLVDASSLAAPVGIDFAEIERPYQKDRESWLVQICHTEYTVEELAQGIWLNRIAPALH